jgi:putative transcriptional regulator
MMDIEVGDLLIAPPKITDSRFEKSVLLIAHHRETSLAFCLNKKTGHRLSDIVRELNLNLPQDIDLYWGGPVHTNTVWMIHDSSWQHDATVQINDEWFFTSHFSMFHQMADRDMPERFRIVFGCASWAPGQLEAELEGSPPWSKNHSWLVLEKPDPEWLLECDVNKLWIDSTDLCSKKAVAQWIP